MTKKRSRITLKFLLPVFAFCAVALVLTPTPAQAAACSGSTVTVNPLHRPDSTHRPFYIDDGTTKRSGYVGWSLQEANSSVLGNDVWIKLTSFSGVLNVASNQDAIFPVRGTSNSGLPSTYAYLTATGASNSAQTFSVEIYNGYPFVGNSAVCEFADGFSKVIDILEANANKVTNRALSNSTPVLGGTFALTVTGSTGTISQQFDQDESDGWGVVSLSPAMENSWPANAFNLIGVTFTRTASSTTAYDELRHYFDDADTAYTARYDFIVRGSVVGDTTISPLSAVASGAQGPKYTGAVSGGSDFIASPTIPISASKSVNSKTEEVSGTSWLVTFKVVLTNSSASTLTIDRVQDNPTPDSAWTYKSNSTTLDGSAFSDSLITTSGGILYFAGPVTISANTSRTLIYGLVLTGSTSNTVGAEFSGGTAQGTSTVTVNPTVNLVLSPNSFSDATVGSAVSATALSATGCVASGAPACAYTYAISVGSLPTGLSLNSSSGAITGTPTTAGSFTFTARVSDNYNGVATKQYTWTVNRADQTLSITSLGTSSKTYPYSQALNITTSKSGTGTITFSVANGTATGCQIGGGSSSTSATATITASTSGTCLISASIAQDDNYNSATTSSNSTFTFNRADQTLSITSLGTSSKTYPYSQALNITTSKSGTGTITFSVANGTATGCQIGGGSSSTSATATITASTSGTCLISASIAQDDNYNSATTSSNSTFTFNKASLTVTASSPTVTYGDSIPAITPSYSGFVNSETASSDSFVTGLVAPTCTTTYTTSSNVGSSPSTSCTGGSSANYTFGTYTNGSVTINRANQIVTWTPTTTYGTGSTTPITWSSTASGSGGGAITYSVTNSGGALNCSISGGGLTWTSGQTGTCEVTATAAITTNYNSGSTAVTFTITNKLVAVITLSYTDIVYGASATASPTFSKGSSDGNTISYSRATSSSSVCSIDASSGVVTIVSAGNCVVTVNVSGGSTYEDGSAGDTLTISKATLTVTPDPQTRIFGDAEGSYSLSVTGFVLGENASSAAGYTAPTCDSDYTTTTSVASSPRTISCSGGSSTNYNFTTTATAHLSISNPTPSTKNAEEIDKNKAKLKGESNRTLNDPKFCIKAAEFTNKSQCESGGTTRDASSSASEYVFLDTGLSPSTTYYYVLHGKVSTETFEGGVKSFKTKPNVETKAPSSKTARSARLNATVSEALTNPRFCYKTTSFTSLADCLSGGSTGTAEVVSSPTSLIGSFKLPKKSAPQILFGYLLARKSSTPSGSVVPGTTYYALSLSSLNPSTTYYYIIYGTVDGSEYDGGVQNFTTDPEDSGGSGGGSGGSGGTSSTPIVTPGPKIDSISRSLVCFTGTELTISGSYFDDGRVTFDGTSVVIRDISGSTIKVSLPSSAAGRRTITVTTPHGSAVAYIDYVSVPKPKYEPIRIPYLAQGDSIYLPFSATGASSYSLNGKLPAGLSFNTSTGLISGVASENGIFVFTIVATGLCGDTNQVIELDIDAPTPNAISHRINFTPNSCAIPDSAKASLERFLEKAKGLSPRNIIPEIYVSGGGKASDPNGPLADCRQEAICDFLLLENLLGDVLSDVFTGSENRIEIIVYWPRPNDGN